jgi:hypothetical protein
MGALMVCAEQAKRYGLITPKPTEPSERFISPNTAGRILNVTGEAVKQWIYSRKLPATKLSNGYWKIKVSDLETYVHRRDSSAAVRVLIMAADRMQAQIISRAVQQFGHMPVVAHSPSDAMLKTADFRPRVVIADVEDGKSAWGFLKWLRECSYSRCLSIIAFSARTLSDEEADLAAKLKVQAFLKPPLDSELVWKEITRGLSANF